MIGWVATKRFKAQVDIVMVEFCPSLRELMITQTEISMNRRVYGSKDSP